MTSVKRLFVLLCGFEIIPKTVSTYNIGARFIISVPISAYLLDTDQGWVLFDTGLDEANLRDRDKLDALYLSTGWDPQPVVKPHHELERQLNEIGIGFADIATVILSHLHADHTGHIKHMPHAKFIVAQREWDFVLSGKAPSYFFPSDYALPGLDWHLIDGDAEVMPGLNIIATPGHSPGHQSLVIELPNTGPCVLAADVGDLMINFTDEILPGGMTDQTEALASIRRINAVVAEKQAMLFLTHDPELIQQIKLAPDYYD
ncbi:N-acyl homoserine lactonase family protein [Devosia sp.]|uniref:N-acyl homoserine lactonase family protein n=1 Tax=Devosia sp. TaxID=1871048 RepID=UPI0032661B6D